MIDRVFTRSLSKRTRTSAAYWSAPRIVSSDLPCAPSRISWARFSASRKIDWSCRRIAACSCAAPMIPSASSRAFPSTRSLS